MERTRTQKSFLNLVFSMLLEVVTVISGLIVPRLILTEFGSVYNGTIASITQFIGLITIARLGVAGAARVALYKSLAEKDLLGTSRIIRAIEKLMRKIAYIFIVYVVLLMLLYKILSNSSLEFWESALLVLIISMGTFSQYFFGLTYHTLLVAEQKTYIYNILQIVQTIANIVIVVVLVKLDASIFIIKLANAIVFVTGPIWLKYYVEKKYKLIKECEPDEDALLQKKDVFGLAVANFIHDNTDMVVLTVFTNAETVSVYSVYYIISNGLRKLLAVLTSGLEAAFGNMYAKGERDSIARNLSLLELLIFGFATIIFTCAGLLIIPFIKLYTEGVSDAEYIQPMYACLLILGVVVYGLRIPYVTIVQAAGHYKQTKSGSYIEALLNIVISIALVWKFSLIGVVIGTLIADLFRTIQYAKYACDNLIDKTYQNIVKRLLWMIVNTIISFLVSKYVLSLFLINSWFDWLKCAMCSFGIVLGVLVMSAYLFYKNDFKNLLKIISRIIYK